MNKLVNDSGSFWVDDRGVLRKFDCSESNLYRPLGRDKWVCDERQICFLNIPEGVAVLPAGAFDGYFVHYDITLPDTLTAMGDGTGGVFRGCSLSELRLPEKLSYLAEDSFFAGDISRIDLPDGMEKKMLLKCVRLFQNQTTHGFLSYPMERLPDDPEPQVSVRELRNECGCFHVDTLGVLRGFVCSPENNADSCPPEETRLVFRLNIPEGVTVLGENAFSGWQVLQELTLPASLALLGAGNGCAFAGAALPEVHLPGTLKNLGSYAFGSSTIHALYLPERMPWKYNRHFKSARIGALHLPRRYQDPKSAMELGGGVLHSLHVNGADIGQVVWEE